MKENSKFFLKKKMKPLFIKLSCELLTSHSLNKRNLISLDT